MVSPSRENTHRFYPLFLLVVVAVVVALSQVTVIVANQLILPLVYSSDQSVRLANNDGTLSNGDRLTGWRLGVYFGAYGLSLLVASGVALVGLERVWPKKRPATFDGRASGGVKCETEGGPGSSGAELRPDR